MVAIGITVFISFTLFSLAFFCFVRGSIKEGNKCFSSGIKNKDQGEVFLSFLGPLLCAMAAVNERYSFSRSWVSQWAVKWKVLLVKAGLQSRITPEVFLALKQFSVIVFFLFLFGSGVMMKYPLFSFLILAFSFFLPDIWVSDAIKSRHFAIRRNLTEALDTFALVMGAGVDFGGAVEVYTSGGGTNPLIEEFSVVRQEMLLGKSRSEALAAMAKRADCAALNNFVSVVTQAERTGASLNEVLIAQSEDLRQRRFQLAEEMGQKAPIKMLAPLLLLIFPNVFIILFAPMILNFVYR